MSIKKINLSALNWQNNTQTDSEITQKSDIEKIEMVVEEKITPQIKVEAIKAPEINSKRKISLKDLKKSHVSLKEENQEEITEISKSIESENTIVKQEINIESPVSISKEEEINFPAQSEVSELPETHEEVFTITDGDTNCNIVKEEKSEIFGNYKGSFSENNTSNDVVVAEVVTPIEEIKKEVKEETKKSERKMDNEKTNLERYADGEEKWKKSLKKKVLFSWLASILAVSIPWVIFLQWWFLKSNVSETKQIPTEIEIQVENTATDSQLPVETQPEITPQTQETPQEVNTIIETEIIPETQTENNQVWNTDIVKENNTVEVANTQKNTKIDEKLHNYLLEKYKK